jgi:hypothetical protein
MSIRAIERRLVGLTRFELVTPRLSSVCSNQLSYRPPTSLALPSLARLRSTASSYGVAAFAACLAEAAVREVPFADANEAKAGRFSQN